MNNNIWINMFNFTAEIKNHTFHQRLKLQKSGTINS